MKALDAFLEKPVRDSGFDYRTGRQLSREGEDLLRKHFDEKSKMSVASNYFALASPIMPVFLLGAFMLLDKLDNPLDRPDLRAHEFTRQREGLSQHLYVIAMREKMEAERKKNGLECSRPMEGFGPIGDKRAPKKKQAELMLDGKPSERLNGPILLSKAQTDVHKIVKKKMALETHLEVVSKEQDFQAASKVSAQLEILNKQLKKLGC